MSDATDIQRARPLLKVRTVAISGRCLRHCLCCSISPKVMHRADVQDDRKTAIGELGPHVIPLLNDGVVAVRRLLSATRRRGCNRDVEATRAWQLIGHLFSWLRWVALGHGSFCHIWPDGKQSPTAPTIGASALPARGVPSIVFPAGGVEHVSACDPADTLACSKVFKTQ